MPHAKSYLTVVGLFLATLCTGTVGGQAFAQTTTATLYTAGTDVFPDVGTHLGSPAGGFHDGTYFWVADRASDLGRLTPVPELNRLPITGGDYLFLFSPLFPELLPPLIQNNLILTGVGLLAGQPVYDRATGIGYVPYGRSGRGGPGILRFQITNSLGTSAVAIATTAGLSGRKVRAVAVGPDGHLYVGMDGSGDILRIVNPRVGTTQVVQTIGKNMNGRPVYGLAFLGSDLYIAQKDGLTRIANVTACNSGCQAVVVPGSTLNQTHWAIAADTTTDTLYVAQNAQIFAYNVAAQTQTPVVNAGTYPNGEAVPLNFSNTGAGLTIDGNRTLWIGDNVATGLTFEGRVWTLQLPAIAP